MNISEILVVVLVALIVIKPEQLPGTAFKLGQWTKRLKSTIAKLRQEIDGAVNPKEAISEVEQSVEKLIEP